MANVASCHTGLFGARVALRTVLSAEPVASTNSLKGLKPRQLTSAACASTACTTPAGPHPAHSSAIPKADTGVILRHATTVCLHPRPQHTGHNKFCNHRLNYSILQNITAIKLDKLTGVAREADSGQQGSPCVLAMLVGGAVSAQHHPLIDA